MTHQQQSLLLQVASQIQVAIPPAPPWFVDDYKQNHGITGETEANINLGRLNHAIDVSWQTYHLSRCAMNLINSCELIESQLAEKAEAESTEN